MNIRKAKIKDLEGLVTLKNELTDHHAWLNVIYRPSEELLGVTIDHLKQYIESPENFIFVAEDDEKLVGYIAGSIREDVYLNVQKMAKIKNFLVTKDLRNKKVGKSLFTVAKEHLKETGADFIEVTVDAGNDQAIGAYKKLGFNNHSLTLSKKI